ncbi:hypothetical protein SAY87_018104 [Trapa incisa]|uniref:Late embryogenesis abundant protein n=1 Tax=Trapa incisa TaxID=236973 RepID=A0AAN7QTH0_9MYRT|nr:hypothetical protein SAY87_018104 [Trapa incisa]
MYRRLQFSLCKSVLRHHHPFELKPLHVLRSFTAIPAGVVGADAPITPSKKRTGLLGSNPEVSRGRDWRGLSSETGNQDDQDKVVDLINLKFAEAREEIEMAMESKETVYFNEEAECARAAVKEVVELFEGLLAKLSERDRASLQRSMGLKIEQLKAELKQLDD